MREPRIQYAKTSDGVNIAYYTMGERKPALVMMPDLIGSHTELVHRIPVARTWFQSLARNHQVVRYDTRGTALSDRAAPDYTSAGRLLDLEAVADKLALDRFILMGNGSQALVAVEYAVKHPERLTNLILWCPYARASDYLNIPEVKAFIALIDADWDMFAESLARGRVLGWSSGDEAHRLAQMMKESCSQEVARAAFDGLKGADVSGLLSQITVPTLVAHRRHLGSPHLELGREVAALTPGAHFVIVPGAALPPYLGHVEELTAAIGDFLGESISMTSDAPGPETIPSGTAVILFADIVDSTALTERVGDAAFRAKARDLDATLRTIIRDHAGTPIEGKLLGDGVLATFASARQAIEAALECGMAGDDAGLPLHLGLHAGDVIREENNVFGGAVNVAARISGLSAPGEVLVSDIVRGLARTSAGVDFEDRGKQPLKGVGEPVRVWAVSQRMEDG
jgi:class 3 adenylate cyclase